MGDITANFPNEFPETRTRKSEEVTVFTSMEEENWNSRRSLTTLRKEDIQRSSREKNKVAPYTLIREFCLNRNK